MLLFNSQLKTKERALNLRRLILSLLCRFQHTQPQAYLAKKILNNTRLYNSDPSVISPIFFHLVQPTIARNTKWHSQPPGRPRHTKGIFPGRRSERKVRALRLLLWLVENLFVGPVLRAGSAAFLICTRRYQQPWTANWNVFRKYIMSTRVYTRARSKGRRGARLNNRRWQHERRKTLITTSCWNMEQRFCSRIYLPEALFFHPQSARFSPRGFSLFVICVLGTLVSCGSRHNIHLKFSTHQIHVLKKQMLGLLPIQIQGQSKYLPQSLQQAIESHAWILFCAVHAKT